MLFYAGLATVFLALASPLDHLSGELFLAHMVQHLLLLLVAPPLILLSAPMIPVLRGVPRPLRRAAVIPVAKFPPVRRSLRLLTRPLIAWSLFVSMVLLWHMPAAYGAALTNAWVHAIEHLSFSTAAFLFWWNVVDPIPLRPNLTLIARVPYVFLASVPNFVLSAFITFSTGVLYPYYIGRTDAYGLDVLDDQEIGGVIMWIPGAFILLGTLLLVLVFVVRTEERTQRERERRDAALARRGIASRQP